MGVEGRVCARGRGGGGVGFAGGSLMGDRGGGKIGMGGKRAGRFAT